MISVIVPVYNTEEFLSEQRKSINYLRRGLEI